MQDSVWQAVLGEVELSVSHGNYVTWFKNSRLLRHKDGVMTIGVTNIFMKQQLSGKWNQMLMDILIRNGIDVQSLEFKVQTGLISKKSMEPDEIILHNPVAERPLQTITRPSSTPNHESHSYRQGINSRYTFDNFIVGSGSDLAYAACQAVASNPGTKYNPLFLYGGVGIGKTHLIQAVGNTIALNKPQTRVVYATIEQFVQEFLHAIRYKKAGGFAEHYRSADVLIIDDIQFIAGKEKTQEEFFHTFNALHQANKQVIISSDRPPKDIPTLQDRLLSRFSMGMTIDMQAPDFETRCVILQAKSSNLNISLGEDVIEHIAHLVTNNVRELEGFLNQLLAHCEMRKVEPTLAVAEEVLGSIKRRPKHISARQVIEKTAKYYQLNIEDIVGPKRDKEIVVPRQIAMYLLREEFGMSFPKIAHELGRKDHTTAIHSVTKIGNEIALSASLREQIDTIRERLYV